MMNRDLDSDWRLACIAHLEQLETHPNVLSYTDGIADGFARLRDLTVKLKSNTSHAVSDLLKCLVADAYHELSSSKDAAWCCLHTDASILLALALSTSSPTHAIAKLDEAIILSGAAGEGRLDLILSMIAHIQTSSFPIRDFTLNSKPYLPPVEGVIPSLATSSGKIPPLSKAPSLLRFQQEYSRNPFILRAFAREWSAMTDHPWTSAEYLRSVSGPGRVVPIEIGSDYRNEDWNQKIMSWDEFLSSLDLDGQPRPAYSLDVFYLAQHNLFSQFPALRADIEIPDYVYADIDPIDFPGYKRPGNDEGVVLSAWLGPKGTLSPAHIDPHNNFFVQVVGRKSVWLAPPSSAPYMSADSRSLSGTSSLNVFATQRPDDESEEHNSAEFWTNVVPRASNEILQPGDLLYIPAGWWHALRSEDTSFSVSMWF